MSLFYPLFLDLRGRPVLVVGGGKVALRKTRALLECGAAVTVVAPEAEPDFDALPIQWKQRRFRASDLAGQALAFAATDERSVNERVSAEGKRRGIWVNVADSLEECDFIVPARVRRGPLTVAVSTGGLSPKLAATLRRRIEELLEAAQDPE